MFIKIIIPQSSLRVTVAHRRGEKQVILSIEVNLKIFEIFLRNSAFITVSYFFEFNRKERKTRKGNT
jgi:hypothetical protein